MSSALHRLVTVVFLLLIGAIAAPASASASMDWTADAERPWTSEWASYSCDNSSRFSQVSNPSSQLDRAYRFEVRDGDDSYGERCELGQGNPTRSGFPLFQEGEERWISYQVRLPDDYPIHANSWNVIHQLKQLGAMGTPALSMEVQNGRFHLMNSSDNAVSCCTKSKWSGPAQRNRWVKFSMRVKFSPNPAVGFVELYGDLNGNGQKLLMPKIKTHTMKRDGSGDAVASHSRIGIYRDRNISGTAHAYFDGYTVATDRATAERKAFGASVPPPRPTPAPPKIDWTADAERPWNSEWANYSCESSSRFSQTSAPKAQLKRAYRVEVRDGDDSWGERCELAQGNPTKSGFPLFQEGEERWISYQVRLPDAFPVETRGRWNTIFSLRQNGELGTPALTMEVKRGKFYLMNSSDNGQSCCLDTKWSGAAQRNRWVKFSMRVKFSPNPDVGFVELHGDLDGNGQKLLMPRIRTHTMKRDSSGRAVPSHSRIGIHRDPAISGTAHLYFDGYTVAADRANAERRAFGASVRSAASSRRPSYSLRLRDRLAGTGPSKSRSGNPVRRARVSGRYRGARPRSSLVLIFARLNERWVRVARTKMRPRGHFWATAKVRLPSSRRQVQLRARVPEVGWGTSAKVSLRP